MKTWKIAAFAAVAVVFGGALVSDRPGAAPAAGRAGRGYPVGDRLGPAAPDPRAELGTLNWPGRENHRARRRQKGVPP